MTLTWSGRRQLLYSGVGAIVILLALVFMYERFFTAPATCFDGRQNGSETGIDCGGSSCSLLCVSEAHEPIVLWARAFQTSPHLYSAVAYVQNTNVEAVARAVGYSFRLYDDKNLLVGHRDGIINLPPVKNIPITESNIDVGNSVVVRTLFEFTSDPPAVWHKIPADTYPRLSVSEPVPSDGYSKLSATLINNNASEVKAVSVIVILYDKDDVAVATSKSLIPRIAGRSREPVVFTWPQGVSGAIRFEIAVLPAF